MLQYSDEHRNFPCQSLICCVRDDFTLADPTSDNTAHQILSRLKPPITSLNCRSIRETAYLRSAFCNSVKAGFSPGGLKWGGSRVVLFIPRNTYWNVSCLSLPQFPFIRCFVRWVNHSGRSLYRHYFLNVTDSTKEGKEMPFDICFAFKHSLLECHRRTSLHFECQTEHVRTNGDLKEHRLDWDFADLDWPSSVWGVCSFSYSQ